jgi:hypothetical protein
MNIIFDDPMKDIAKKLDKIASHLESLGMIKEAHDLDVVSNTIDQSVTAQGFITADYLKNKSQQYVNKLYQEYVDSAQGKRAYDQAMKAHPDYNIDKIEAEATTDLILEDVTGWLRAMDKSEGEVDLLKGMLRGKILAGIT